MTYELHPLCTLFPRMADIEFAALCDDIKKNGQREPITIHDGMILDGGNRYRACVEIGTEPDFVEYHGDNIVGYVLSANLHRRHLSVGQHAAIVASCSNWANAQTVGKPKSGHVAPLQTVADRAAESGASERTQKRADKVAKSDPELAKKVGRGEISLPKAVKMVSPKEEPEHEEPQYTIEDQLRDQVSELQDQLALKSEPDEEERLTAQGLISSLREKVKSLEIDRNAMKSSRDFFQSENAELKKQVAYWRKQAEKK